MILQSTCKLLIALFLLTSMTATHATVWVPIDVGDGVTTWVGTAGLEKIPGPLATTNYLHSLYQVVHARNATSAELAALQGESEATAANFVFGKLPERDSLGGTKPINLVHVAYGLYVDPSLIDRVFIYTIADTHCKTDAAVYLKNTQTGGYSGILLHSTYYNQWGMMNWAPENRRDKTRAEMDRLVAVLSCLGPDMTHFSPTMYVLTRGQGEVAFGSNGHFYENAGVTTGASQVVTEATMLREAGSSQMVQVLEGRLNLPGATIPFVRLESGIQAAVSQPAGTIPLEIRFNPPGVNKAIGSNGKDDTKVLPAVAAATVYARAGYAGTVAFSAVWGFMQGVAGDTTGVALPGILASGGIQPLSAQGVPNYISLGKAAGYRVYSGTAYYAAGRAIGMAHNIGFYAGHAFRYGASSIRMVGSAASAGSGTQMELATAVFTGMVRTGILGSALPALLSGDTNPIWTNDRTFYYNLGNQIENSFSVTRIENPSWYIGMPSSFSVSISGRDTGPALINFPDTFLNPYPW